MDYSLSPNSMSSMFPIPASVSDTHLKLAGAVQLKVLLFFMRNMQSQTIIEDCSSALGITEADVRDALDYWCSCEVLQKAGAATKPIKAKPEPEKKVVIRQKPTREDVIKRGAESVDIKYMFHDVQMKIGRLPTQSELSTLIWLHDNQGLPIPVILLSVQHAAAEGRTNFGYIEKMCLDWVKHGVDTLDKAEKRLNQVYMQRTAWAQVMSAFGIERRRASANEEVYAEKWVNDWGFSKEMLKIAYDKCVDAKQKISFAYINKILENWHKQKITTPKDLEKKETEKTATTAPKKKTSYSLDKIKKKVNQFGGAES